MVRVKESADIPSWCCLTSRLPVPFAAYHIFRVKLLPILFILLLQKTIAEFWSATMETCRPTCNILNTAEADTVAPTHLMNQCPTWQLVVSERETDIKSVMLLQYKTKGRVSKGHLYFAATFEQNLIQPQNTYNPQDREQFLFILQNFTRHRF